MLHDKQVHIVNWVLNIISVTLVLSFGAKKKKNWRFIFFVNIYYVNCRNIILLSLFWPSWFPFQSSVLPGLSSTTPQEPVFVHCVLETSIRRPTSSTPLPVLNVLTLNQGLQAQDQPVPMTANLVSHFFIDVKLYPLKNTWFSGLTKIICAEN